MGSSIVTTSDFIVNGFLESYEPSPILLGQMPLQCGGDTDQIMVDGVDQPHGVAHFELARFDAHSLPHTFVLRESDVWFRRILGWGDGGWINASIIGNNH
jgi:hypothetical protein